MKFTMKLALVAVAVGLGGCGGVVSFHIPPVISPVPVVVYRHPAPPPVMYPHSPAPAVRIIVPAPRHRPPCYRGYGGGIYCPPPSHRYQHHW